ncbi:MAG: YbaN family protein [Candidatus Bipolaricaulis sp.]|nr:YbaN family protein [Candidatus Bipolaricaulis sp.]
MKRSTQSLLIVAGALCVAVGVVGILLPILPTTPFLLLAAFLFARSSSRCHRWLLTNRLCGDYVRRYLEHRAMSRRHKIVTLILLWTGIGCSIALAVSALWLRLLLGVVAVAVTIHILAIRSQ